MTHPALTRALAACARNLFARARLSPDGAVESFSFGPPGALLLDNVLREWRLSCVLDAPHEMFPFSGEGCDVMQALADARALNPLPLGVAHSWVETVAQATSLSAASGNEGKSALLPGRRTVLRASVLLPGDLAVRAFHDWQRHRAIWWRKLSSDPGRYETCPLANADSVAIRASFAWGAETLETLTVRDAGSGLRLLRAETSLEGAALAFLCDALDATRATRMHRKLAPYKIGLVPTADDAALVQLARFLCRQLRESGTSCMLAPPNLPRQSAKQAVHAAKPPGTQASKRRGKKVTDRLEEHATEPLGEQVHNLQSEQVLEGLGELVTERLALHDALGVPFTLLLPPDALRTGLASLRSRDSTLQEQIHVTDLKTYVELLLKNY